MEFGHLPGLEPSSAMVASSLAWVGNIHHTSFLFSFLVLQTELCDFENGMCGYTQDKTEQFDWKLHKGHTPSYGTGPSHDHTYQTSAGKWQVFDVNLSTCLPFPKR